MNSANDLRNFMEMEVHVHEAVQLMKALANEHRLLILCNLAEGEKSVGELNERVPLSQSALSQHLSVLRRDGLVATRREAQTVHYRLTNGPARKVIAALHETYCCKGKAK
jgi:DNA-binding transcriptional ArsR family regulator